MIDLRNKCVLVRTQEEYEKILEEAEKQGFRWFGLEKMNPLPNQRFPDILEFDRNYKACRYAYPRGELVEASELLGMKEMTAGEFVKGIERIYNCDGRKCQDCVFNYQNTKCKKTLCSMTNWVGCTDELVSIVKSGRATIKPQNEMILESFQDFLDSPKDSPTITSDFIESLQIVVDKLKEQVK